MFQPTPHLRLRQVLLTWPVPLAMATMLAVPLPGAGQEILGTEGPARAEVLWHEARALFPIRIHLPADFDSTRVYPTVVALHGMGGSSQTFARIGRAFAKAGFIAVLPEAPYPVPYGFADSVRHSTWELSTWTGEMGIGPPLTDDLAIEQQSSALTWSEFLPSVVERVQERYRVGPLYAFGYSLGGVYALAGGFYHRDRFDGVVAFGVSGFSEEWFTARGESLEAGRDLPIRLVQGRSDPLVPFSEAERARDLLQHAGYVVVLDGFDGGHAVPDAALERAVQWIEGLVQRE